ncbi:MAG: ParB/RepB/Spo0J family partition protein [Rhodospirillales bacterium]|nr:ParB/RepB/Spo0J family partition protein [Rhodospirillales bacterium]
MADDGKRSNLGRGLDALLGDDPGRPAGDADARFARMAPIETLRPGRHQPRRHFPEADIDELAASIRELGILQPLLVRSLGPEGDGPPEAYEIIAGERRWRAAQRAKLHEVPVIERQLSDAEALEIALVENLQREDLSPVDEAQGYRRLADEFGHTQEDLARILGKSRSHIANMLRLLNLPDGVKALLDGGGISPGHARALLAARDPAAAAKAVVRRGLNVRQTERLIQKENAPAGSSAAGAPDKDVDTIALERELAALLGLRVEIRPAGESGSLTVHYDTLEQLDHVLDRLRYGTAERPAGQPAEQPALEKDMEKEMTLEEREEFILSQKNPPIAHEDVLAHLEERAARDRGEEET